jgi:beta-lactam-binding protein with PASTA domain
MPDLTGLPLLSAQAALNRVGLKAAPPRLVEVSVPPVGQGNAAPVPPIKPGAVLAQQPPAGTRVDQSMLVTLTVAK